MERHELLDHLKSHQHEVGLILDEAVAILKTADPARTKMLALLRWQLLRRLRSYQLFKHLSLFDPLIQSGDSGVATLASDMKARCLTVGEAYNEHVKRWTACDIERTWPLYEEETLTVITIIREHLDREDRESELLLFRAQQEDHR